MGIKHSVVKASGDKGLASEWNANHVIDGDVDFNKFEALKFVFNSLASPPADPIVGQIYFNTSINQLEIWSGIEWEPLITYTTTNGNLQYGDSYDFDIDIIPTLLAESTTNLKEGTYIILAGLSTALYRFTAGWAGTKIWIGKAGVMIPGSTRQMHLKLDADSEKDVSIQSAIICNFTGTEKVELYAQMIDGGEFAYGHTISLDWIRIS